MMSERLAGQAILVVGRAALGWPLAVRAVQEAAKVVFCLTDQDEPRQQALQESIATLPHPERLTLTTINPLDESTIEPLFGLTFETLGVLHAVVVIVEPLTALEPTPLIEVSLDTWNQGVAQTLRFPFWLSQAAVNEFLYSGEGGRLVYVLPAVPTPPARHTSTLVARTALEGLARSICKEYGARRVACNIAVQPTSLAKAAHPQGSSHQPTLDAHALPIPLVETALFLASGEAAFINGEVITLSL